MVEVRRSTVIAAPIEEVWRLLRDFNGHVDWHPAVAESRIEEGRPVDVPGAVRRFRLTAGGELREQLLSLDDRRHRLTYCILDSPIPLIGYVSTLELRPVTDGGGTFWSWHSAFRAPPGQEAALAQLVGERIYEAGFDAVKRHFGQRVALRPAGVAPAGVAPAAARHGAAESGHAVVLTAHGGPENLAWQEVAALAPGEGELRLRQSAVGVNFIDVYCRTGYFPLLEPPGVLGMEAAGVVTDVGPGVAGLQPGDRVAYAGPPLGAYAELRTLPAELVVPLPSFLDEVTAAAGLLKGLTAEFLLHRVHAVKEGDWVLVQAAAGGVGSLLCQWASRLGARVIGTVGSREKARQALARGCAHPILYREEDFVARVREITGGAGCDVIYDAIGLESVARGVEALATRGHIVSYGQAAGPLAPFDLAGLAAKSGRVSRPNYGHYAGTRAQVAAGSQRLFAALERGDLAIEIGLRLPLREAAEAHRRLEARETTGSTVLIV